jgi:hypothetical protein
VLVKEEAEPAGGTRSAARKFDELVRGRQQLGRLRGPLRACAPTTRRRACALARPKKARELEQGREVVGADGRNGSRARRLFGSSYFSRAGNFSILRYIFFRETISLSTFSTKYQ